MAENSPANTSVGAPVTAAGPGDRTLTYHIIDASGNFAIDPDTGQISVAASAMLDYETTPSYAVNIKADAGDEYIHFIGVTINLTDVAEPPAFDGEAVRQVAENSAAGAAVGAPVTATDPEDDTLTYSLTGSDAFIIDVDTGQISVAESAALDYEATRSYTVTVSVTDGKDADGNADSAIDATVEVTINVIDVTGPAKPDAPTVEQSSTDPTTMLDVSWPARCCPGPSSTGYDVRYRKEGAPDWKDHAFTGTGTTTTISGLDPGATHEVQVAATNDEGLGPWSETGAASTKDDTVSVPDGKDPDGNVAPPIDDTVSVPDGKDPDDNAATITDDTVGVPDGNDADGNVAPPIDDTVSVPDGNDPDGNDAPTIGDTVSVPDGNDADGNVAPTIDDTVSVPDGNDPDGNVAPTIGDTVSVPDGNDADDNDAPAIDDTVEITINITDVDEPPARPDAPSVAPSSTSPGSTLEVTWTAPDNAGRPAITGYSLHYRKQGATDWTPVNITGTVTGTTITGLEPGTTYEVQVAATNNEGTSPWSETGAASTRSDRGGRNPQGPGQFTPLPDPIPDPDGPDDSGGGDGSGDKDGDPADGDGPGGNDGGSGGDDGPGDKDSDSGDGAGPGGNDSYPGDGDGFGNNHGGSGHGSGGNDGDSGGGGNSAVIREVQVNAANDEGAGEWSDPGTGSNETPNPGPIAVNPTATQQNTGGDGVPSANRLVKHAPGPAQADSVGNLAAVAATPRATPGSGFWTTTGWISLIIALVGFALTVAGAVHLMRRRSRQSS